MPVEINLTPTCLKFEIGESKNPIKARHWPVSEPDFGAVLVHGLGAHSGWYEAFARKLQENKVDAVSYDQAGFGERDKKPVKNLGKTWNQELGQVISCYEKLMDGRPFFLMGNSMGAMVALRWLCTSASLPSNLKGLVLFSPGFGGNPSRFTPQYQFQALLTSFFAPQATIKLPYGVEDITRHQDVQAELQKDPQMMLSIWAGMGFQLFQLTRDVNQLEKQLPVPLFLAMAGVEHIVDNKATLKYFEQVKCPSKTKHSYDEAFHDLMFDSCQDRLIQDLLTWMNESVGKRN